MSTATLSQLDSRSATFRVPATGMSLKQFREWAESDDFPQLGRVLFYRGELYFDLSGEPIDYHLAPKDAINGVIGGMVRQRELGRYFSHGAGLDNEDADVGNEPDALFARWETIKSGKLYAPPEKQGKHTALVGTPDWVCEIVSDSSVTKDTKVLREAYHAAGIPEYWLIDPREDTIDFQLLIWKADGYEAAIDNKGWKRSPVFEREFQITRRRDRVGWWLYDLLVR